MKLKEKKKDCSKLKTIELVQNLVTVKLQLQAVPVQIAFHFFCNYLYYSTLPSWILADPDPDPTKTIENLK